MERYTTLWKTQQNLYAQNSPVIISAGALVKDNETNKVLVQLKFRNISDVIIKAIKIEIIPYSVDNIELSEKTEFQYLDLTAAYNTEFGQKTPVFLSDNTTRAFKVICKSVVFVNGAKWENTDNTVFESTDYPQGIRNRINTTNNFIQFIDFATKEDIKDNTNIFWQRHDKNQINSQLAFLNTNLNYADGELAEKTKSAINQYNSILSAERKADEEFSEEELTVINSFECLKNELCQSIVEIKNLKKKKNRKLIKKISISLSAISAVAVLLVLTFCVFIPSSKYNTAIELINQESYQEAIDILSTINTFKDSADKIVEAKNGIYINKNKEFFESTYSEATNLLNNKKYVEAYRKFEKIEIYKDVPEKLEEIINIINAEIPKAIENNDFNYALNLLNIPEAKDAETFKDYVKAKRKESISIKEAYDLYKTLPADFYDTAERIAVLEKYIPYTGTFHRPNAIYSQPFEFELTVNENDELCYYMIPLQVYTESDEYDYCYKTDLMTMLISKNKIYRIWYAIDTAGNKYGPHEDIFTR